jgi:hypothetical protein
MLWVDWIEVERVPNAAKPTPPGFAALQLPLDDKSPAPAATELRAALERFATEAFRGTAPPADYVDRLMSLYEVRRKAGDKPVAALKETLSIVLTSPMFLYLAELSRDDKRRPLTGAELATRLSYFLWSAPPDAELRKSDLSKPEVLAVRPGGGGRHPVDLAAPGKRPGRGCRNRRECRAGRSCCRCAGAAGGTGAAAATLCRIGAGDRGRGGDRPCRSAR